MFSPHKNSTCVSPMSHTCHMPYASNFLFDRLNNIWWGSSSFCNLLHSPVTSFLLRTKCLPQHPLLDHPQPTFLCLWDRPDFAPTQNIWQNYSSVFFNVYIFGHKERE
jgi:hypothetical protein